MKLVNASIVIEDELEGKGTEILKKLERAGRTCYKSESKITDESAMSFIKFIIKKGHETILEHEKVTVRVICDRAVGNEIVRHRIASYSQESTRYCLAGDTVLYTGNILDTYHSIASLYNNKNNRSITPYNYIIKQLNEDTKIFDDTKIKNIFYNGKQPTIKIKTKLGYELTGTKDHLIFSKKGYVSAGNLNIGDFLGVLDTYRETSKNNKNTESIMNFLLFDNIVSIEDNGIIDVYDIEVDSDYHNFVGNGIIVHNCNYGKEKFNNEITVIEPCFWLDEKGGREYESLEYQKYRVWLDAMSNAEKSYMDLLKLGATPQEARSVLPNSLKTEIVMTMNLREWRHFFKLRTAKVAHPQMIEVADLILKAIKNYIPIIFDDIS